LEGDNPISGMSVVLPALTPALIPCQHAWVLAISNIGNFQGDEPLLPTDLLGGGTADYTLTG
jgi:hypothetical protein